MYDGKCIITFIISFTELFLYAQNVFACSTIKSFMELSHTSCPSAQRHQAHWSLLGWIGTLNACQPFRALVAEWVPRKIPRLLFAINSKGLAKYGMVCTTSTYLCSWSGVHLLLNIYISCRYWSSALIFINFIYLHMWMRLCSWQWNLQASTIYQVLNSSTVPPHSTILINRYLTCVMYK